jgi:hypothetical protein
MLLLLLHLNYMKSSHSLRCITSCVQMSCELHIGMSVHVYLCKKCLYMKSNEEILVKISGVTVPHKKRIHKIIN